MGGALAALGLGWRVPELSTLKRVVTHASTVMHCERRDHCPSLNCCYLPVTLIN